MAGHLALAKTWLARCLVLVCLLVSTGCYDKEQLIEEIRDQVARDRLAEIDLGSYRITLPQSTERSTATTVDLVLFGRATQKDAAHVRDLLESEQAEVRHATLMAIRTATPQELVEPDLATLRGRILQVARELLGEDELRDIGIRDLDVYEE